MNRNKQKPIKNAQLLLKQLVNNARKMHKKNMMGNAFSINDIVNLIYISFILVYKRLNSYNFIII